MQTLLSLNQQSSNGLQPTSERGIAIAVVRKGTERALIEEYLEEIEQLCATVGAEIALRIVQERERLDPATYIGKGKVEQLRSLVGEYAASFVIFDEGLSPVQMRNLQQMLGVKILDRTMLILDIFAQHARTLEAKTQVELAQLQYLYPRLTRLWTHLERQYGGIGTRGPGETQIETDRRLIKQRIAHLKRRLEEIELQRTVQRKERDHLMRFALVGYTNAGKSTLFNLLTNANVLAEDKLFATLDTTVRRCRLPSGHDVLLSDTVGFIRKLPAHLVASFHSTLAEAADSDVLIHVADCSHPALDRQIESVMETLTQLSMESKPQLLVLNKVDQLSGHSTTTVESLRERYPHALLVSAASGYNIQRLLRRMEQVVLERSIRTRLFLPFAAMNQLPYIYSNAVVEQRQETENGIILDLLIPEPRSGMLAAVLEQYGSNVQLSAGQG
jgi:GTP-binding protein HflX